MKPLANEFGAYDGISIVFNILASEILFADPLAVYGYRDMNVLNKRGSHVFFIFANCLIPLILYNFIHVIYK